MAWADVLQEADNSNAKCVTPRVCPTDTIAPTPRVTSCVSLRAAGLLKSQPAVPHVSRRVDAPKDAATGEHDDGVLLAKGMKTAGKCRECARTIDVGSAAWFNKEGALGKKITCNDCHVRKLDPLADKLAPPEPETKAKKRCASAAPRPCLHPGPRACVATH